MPRYNAPIPLALQLFDGNVSKFVRAILHNASGTELSESPVALTHVGGGLYQDSSVLMPNTDLVVASYVVYDDSGFTTESLVYSRVAESFYLDLPAQVDASQWFPALLEAEISPTQTLVGFISSVPVLVGTIALQEHLVGEIIESETL